jgi:hypothetical protein
MMECLAAFKLNMQLLQNGEVIGRAFHVTAHAEGIRVVELGPGSHQFFFCSIATCPFLVREPGLCPKHK